MDPDVLASAAKYHTTVVSNKNKRICALKAEVEYLKRKCCVDFESDKLIKEVDVQARELVQLAEFCNKLRAEAHAKDVLISDSAHTIQGLQKAYVERTRELQALKLKLSRQQANQELSKHSCPDEGRQRAYPQQARPQKIAAANSTQLPPKCHVVRLLPTASSPRHAKKLCHQR